MNIWEADKLVLFILFVIPGFVCLKAYELLIPSQIRDSSKQLVDAVAYSCINYAMLSPLILLVEIFKLQQALVFLYYLFYFFVIFISPVILAYSWQWIRATKFAQKNAPHPIPHTWDFIFNQKKPYWIKVTYKNGDVVGGLYSEKSFASSAPATEQLYLEESWIINDDGAFERRKNNSAGVIIFSTEILHVELREIGNN